ncbi:hypothetical protein ABC977_18010 [Thioalkalicoccus limnaeus]|uniref:Uncharacterized protein n=1 Tax=Thioalkalicoccus limnaeus TaxID=120681 RepID=A0ABV4BLC2_9GAMM
MDAQRRQGQRHRGERLTVHTLGRRQDVVYALDAPAHPAQGPGPLDIQKLGIA